MGVFEFIIALALISGITTVLTSRRSSGEQQGDLPEKAGTELEGIRDALDAMSGRLDRLEEERHFYRDLLEAPGRGRGISPPAKSEDASDSGEPG